MNDDLIILYLLTRKWRQLRALFLEIVNSLVRRDVFIAKVRCRVSATEMLDVIRLVLCTSRACFLRL